MSAKAIRQRKERLSFTLKLLVGLLIVFPLFYGLRLSFLGLDEIFSNPPVLFSKNMSLENYVYVFGRVPMLTYFKNTLIVCAIEVIAQIITSSFAAYAFSFFEFKGRKFLFAVVTASLMIPYESTLICNYLTICNLRLTDTYAGLTLPFLASGMSIFLMRQFYMTLPRELKEASVIDGCSDMGFLVRIAFPLSLSATCSLALYRFIDAYNQYFWPLLVTNRDQMRTLQIGTGILKDSEAANYGIVLAAAMVVIVPAVLFFIIGQKWLVKGMIAGAVKG